MRILVADDDPITRIRLRNSLERMGFAVLAAADGNKAQEILTGDDPPRLAILDWEMPGLAGVDLCRMIRAAGDEPYTYVVILTGRSRMEDVIEAMDAGADSFLCKPVELAELKARLRPGLRMLELQRALIQAREDYRHEATHDALTGMLNRRAIMEILRDAVQNPPVAVALVDIDHFKHINDTWGHDVGDKVLIHTAHCLVASVRPEDRVGRIGGEEFLVVLPGCNVESALSVGERLRSQIEAETICYEGTPIPLTLSVGVVAVKTLTPYEQLLHAADEGLYAAKRGGRNRVILSQLSSPSQPSHEQ